MRENRFFQNISQIFSFLIILLILGASHAAFSTQPPANGRKNVPAPKDQFGFVPGTEGRLADYDQIVAYLEKLDAASPRLILQRLGKTTEGNDFVMAIISSPENLKKLEQIKKAQAQLADARKTSREKAESIIATSPAVVLVNCSIHATEVGPAQMAPQLAYELSSKDSPRIKRILKNTVLLLVPVHNPDGQKMVVNWYRKVKGTKYVSARPPFLYQKYVDHDNNRDWFMFTQAETRITVEKIHNVWRPQITVDMHQMGKNGARLFVPPYIDPIEPNVDPILVSQIARAGTDVLATLTTEGKKGVVMNAIFDAWTPARAYPHYHHGIRFLTETASANLATSVTIKPESLGGRFGYNARKSSWNFPDPWPGGKWTLADIVEYNRAAALAIVDHVARNREAWLRGFYQVARKAIAPKSNPYAFLIPPQQDDPHAVTELVDVLQTAMVEVHEARKSFVADGATYPKGTLVVKSAQPYGAFARAMLQRQHYPEIRAGNTIRRPYDVTAHTLPLFLGVEAIAASDSFPAKFKLLKTPPQIEGQLRHGSSKYFLLTSKSNQAYKMVNALFDRHFSVARLKKSYEANGRKWVPGTFVIEASGEKNALQALAREFGLNFVGVDKIPETLVRKYRQPRLGVYKSYWPVIDEGWTRWILEKYGFKYTTLRDADVRSGNLHEKFDVIILPSQSKRQIVDGRPKGTLPDKYTGGIGDVGVRQLESFVRQGGTLLAFDRASQLPIEDFYLPAQNILANLKPESFYGPGSVLRVYVKSDHPLGYGMPEQAAILFVNSPAFQSRGGETIVSYPPTNPLLSGWISGAKRLANRQAMLQMPFGDGQVILYGFRPQFRAQFRATYKLVFNAILQSAVF